MTSFPELPSSDSLASNRAEKENKKVGRLSGHQVSGGVKNDKSADIKPVGHTASEAELKQSVTRGAPQPRSASQSSQDVAPPVESKDVAEVKVTLSELLNIVYYCDIVPKKEMFPFTEKMMKLFERRETIKSVKEFKDSIIQICQELKIGDIRTIKQKLEQLRDLDTVRQKIANMKENIQQAKPLPPTPPRPAVTARDKTEFKHSDPVEILRRIEERESATETREQKIDKFVANYLHPYIIGEKTKPDSIPLMTKLFKALDPTNTLTDAEKKEIEKRAYDTYLKEAAKGLYIRDYLNMIESQFDKTVKPVPDFPVPLSTFPLIHENNQKFTALVNALKEAVPRDFPSRSLDQVSKDAAAALKAVNKEKVQHLMEEGDRMINDQKALGKAGNPDIMKEGLYRKKRGEELAKELRGVQATPPASSKEEERQIRDLMFLIYKHYGNASLLGPELASLLKNHDLSSLIIPMEGNREEYALRLRDHLYNVASAEWEALVEKNPDANAERLKNAIDEFITLVNTSMQSKMFAKSSGSTIALVIAKAVIQAGAANE